MSAPAVQFRSLQPWALLPTQHRVDRAAARDRAEVYRENFRYVRAERRSEHCPPWTMGQELGWRVVSPIDIEFTVLDQIELDATADPEGAASAADRDQMWKRERSHLAVERNSWLHLHQFRTDRGWENMFLPNGQGTVEWRMGWTVDIPRGYFLLVTGLDDGPLHVPTGVLTSTVTARFAQTGGASVAVRPASVTISRGQEIARIILLHADSFRATAEYEPGAPTQ